MPLEVVISLFIFFLEQIADPDIVLEFFFAINSVLEERFKFRVEKLFLFGISLIDFADDRL